MCRACQKERRTRSRAEASICMETKMCSVQSKSSILHLFVIIATIVASATTAIEYAAAFIAAQVAISLRLTLGELG